MEGKEFKNEPNLDLDLLPRKKSNKKKIKLLIIILIILSILILLLAGALIYFIFFKKDESSINNKKEEEETPFTPQPSSFFQFFGTKYSNLRYDENGKIYNSFKIKGENYIKEMGSINNDQDYDSNELNVYDLYIPRYAEERKNETNGIMLWIHGGWWIGGELSMTSPSCELYSQLGYISANINYTLINSENKISNIFRILDEITASIKAIKNELIKRGFDGNKLLLSIGGVSAGAHIALLYSYLIKDINSIIPIKFVIDLVGPIGLYEKYFYKLKSHNDTLDTIENITLLEKAKEEGKIIKAVSDSWILMLMNGFSGNKYTKEEINEMMDENGSIKYENEKYKELFNITKYGFITEIEDKHKLPTICIYGGRDDEIGVSSYAYLKEKADKDGRHIDYIYSRYEGHILVWYSTEDGKQSVYNMNSLIIKYLKKYFG